VTTQENTSDFLQEARENLNSIIITEVEQSTVALLASSAESSQTTAQTALSDDQDAGKSFPSSISVISQPASQVIEGAKDDNPASSLTMSSEACTEIQAHQTTDRTDIGNLYS
jgi:hypothetical protein